MTRLFDANAMVGKFPTGALAYAAVDGLRAAMAGLGIERALVYHSLAWRYDPPFGNRLLIEELAGDGRLFPCWVLLPTGAGEIGSPTEFLAAMARDGVRAARAFPRDHGYDLASPDCAPLLALLAARRVPLFLDLEQAGWAMIEAVAAAQPDLPVVACRVGYRSLRAIAGVLERRANVHLDLAYFGTHQGVEWVARRFGARRLIFGTGMPLSDPGGAVTRLLYSELPDAEVAAVGAGNLERLLEGGAR